MIIGSLVMLSFLALFAPRINPLPLPDPNQRIHELLNESGPIDRWGGEFRRDPNCTPQRVHGGIE